MSLGQMDCEEFFALTGFVFDEAADLEWQAVKPQVECSLGKALEPLTKIADMKRRLRVWRHASFMLLKEYPADPYAYFNAAGTLLSAEDCQEALAAYRWFKERGLDFQTCWPNTDLQLAISLIANQEYAEAKNLLFAWIMRGHVEMCLFQGLALHGEGDFQNARRWYSRFAKFLCEYVEFPLLLDSTTTQWYKEAEEQKPHKITGHELSYMMLGCCTLNPPKDAVERPRRLAKRKPGTKPPKSVDVRVVKL